MAAMAFDSMTMLSELEKTGMPRVQAEGVVAAVTRVHEINAQDTAGVRDLVEVTVKHKDPLMQKMHDGFEQINKKLTDIDLKFADVDKRFVQMDAKIDLLRKDLEAQPNKIIIRLSVAVAGLLAVLFAALRYLG